MLRAVSCVLPPGGFSHIAPFIAPFSTASSSKPVIAIRREDKTRWERRAALSPDHVKRLVKGGFKVIVQPSGLRIFSDENYRQAGAEVSEDIERAQIILGVKEVKPQYLIPNKTYFFFSHVIKAQPYNMKMLDVLLERNIKHVDYESIKDAQGMRLVKFGKFAGNAGFIDFTAGLGNRLLALGYNTPFMELGMSYMYPSLAGAKKAVKALGQQIHKFGLPSQLGPMIFAFTGEGGAVCSGSKEVFQELPHTWVPAKDLPRLCEQMKGKMTREIYGVKVAPEDATEPLPGHKYSFQDFVSHPEHYRGTFHERIAPYVSCIINGTYWDDKFPRFITNAQMDALHKAGKHRLIGLADISADVAGSVEFMDKISNLDHPYYVHDLDTHKNVEDMTSAIDPKTKKNNGVLVMSIDNLPSELAKEATSYFGDHLVPFIEQMAHSDLSKPFDQAGLPDAIKRAVITSDKSLTPGFKYIAKLRAAKEGAAAGGARKKVCVFGAGRVAGPVVEYLSRSPMNEITIVDMNLADAERLASQHPNCKAVQAQITEESKVEELISKHDLVISMLPYIYHANVARYCVKHRKNMVTSSYVSPVLKELDAAAKKAGITILNEVGLDPGIDHCSALKIIDEVKESGGKVEHFQSWCGGLPAPETSDNPFGYKFSWSPRGVLLATRNPARFRMQDETNEVPLAIGVSRPIRIMPGFALEGYPNRDSLSYEALYGLKGLKTLIRGTLRFEGYCAVMQNFLKAGLLSDQPHPDLQPGADPITWNALLNKLNPSAGGDLEAMVATYGGVEKSDPRYANLAAAYKWLGLFGETPVPQAKTPLDALCAVMEPKMQLPASERDLVLLHHIFGYRDADGKARERTSSLIMYGEPNGVTSMAKLVGTPAGIASQLILDGTITRKGVLAPMTPDIYLPILKKLEKEGIKMVERDYPLE